jgi:hypothetical protein
MGLYIYSLGQADLLAGRTLPPGHTGAAIEIVEHGTLAAVVSEITALPAPVHRADLQRHDAVNRAVLATGLCIPMRWGTMVADRPACVEILGAQYERWLRTAERLRGRVELSAKLIVPTAPEPEVAVPSPIEDQPGTTYLRTRQAHLAAQIMQEDQARELRTVVKHALDGLADSVVVTHRGNLTAVAALVPHNQAGIAAERLRSVLATNTNRWIVGEPWPPYSFVDETA